MSITIDKAIEILKDYQAGVEMEELREYPDIIRLAIEALKRCKLQRQFPDNVIWETLPGETEEENETRKHASTDTQGD